MNPETNFPEPSPAASKRQLVLRGRYSLASAFLNKALRPLMPVPRRNDKEILWQRLSLTAIAMGLVAAALLLTRPRLPAPAPMAGCGGCTASEASPNICEMRAAPSNPTEANTNVKKSGVPHE